jgi:ABC-type antimicrobial peptide transport system permease subunit
VVTVRTDRDVTALAPMIRERLAHIDDQVPAEFETMGSIVSTSVADRRFTVTVLGAFAAVALILAAIGIYGVVSYSVARRTREMGIRMALGARPAGVRRLVVTSALRTVAVGLAIGTIAAVGASRVMASLLYGVGATDPMTFGLVILLLLGVGWLASAIPARRSARIDPMLTMRAE